MNKNPIIPSDFSNEVKLISDIRLRWLVYCCGWISIGLGILGVFLPILPTSPFLILAAHCFSKSSTKFYNVLLNNKYFGHYIRDWLNTRSLEMPTKLISIFLLAVTVSTSLIFFVKINWIRIIVGLIATCIAVYILRIPTKKNELN